MSGFLANARNTTINGGIFVNNGIQGPWDRLQAAASPSAFFNSGDQLDAPKCHPNTRIAILHELRDFAISRGDMALVKALWLNGPAGAGKSAIARSLCEELHAANALLASYFFKRTDGSRNTHKSFVATITYQIYGTVPEPYRALILAVIQDDPLIFTRSLTTQWESLIMIPLRELFGTNYFHTVGRRLIVIDGLDECSTALAQVSILKEIQRICLAGSPFLFMVASRPEHDIHSLLASSSWTSPGCLLYRLDLDANYEPDKDIGRFLVDKLHEVCLDHPHKDNIPAGWPSAHIIQTLVDKASGLFIYASLVIGYVASNRHQPHKRLDMVLGLRPPKGGLPFAELDTLYDHILSSCQDVDLALEIISFTCLSSGHLEFFASLNALDIDDCIAALLDLRSILYIHPTFFEGGKCHHVVLTHKTLVDFLSNSGRSGKYHRDESRAICKLAGQFLQYTSDPGYSSALHLYDMHYRLPAFFRKFLPQLLQNIHVSRHGFMSLSLRNWYNASKHGAKSSENEFLLFGQGFWNLFPTLIHALKQLATTDHNYVYDYYRVQFRDLIAALPNLCSIDHLHSIEVLSLRKVGNAISVMIISHYPDFPMPRALTRLLLDGLLIEAIPLIFFKIRTQSKHDTAIQCIQFIRSKSPIVTTEDVTVVQDSLRSLASTLPYANYSLDLYSACSPQELYDWFTPFLSRFFHYDASGYQWRDPRDYSEAENILYASLTAAVREILLAGKRVDNYRYSCKKKLGIVEQETEAPLSSTPDD